MLLAPNQVWTLLTGLGDSSVVLPCAILMTFWLMIDQPSRPLGRRWLLLLVSMVMLVVVTKLAYMAWGVGVPSLQFRGLSGHSAMSAIVWPTLMALLAPPDRAKWRWAALALGVTLAIAIGVSRLALHVHSPAEVVSGLAFGVAGVLLLRLSRFTHSVAPRVRGYLALSLLMVLPLVYGHRFPSDHLLQVVAAQLEGNIGIR